MRKSNFFQRLIIIFRKIFFLVTVLLILSSSAEFAGAVTHNADFEKVIDEFITTSRPAIRLVQLVFFIGAIIAGVRANWVVTILMILGIFLSRQIFNLIA